MNDLPIVRHADIRLARDSIAAAPVPAVVVDPAAVYVNAAAAGWLASLGVMAPGDAPPPAGELPVNHPAAASLRQTAITTAPGAQGLLQIGSRRIGARVAEPCVGLRVLWLDSAGDDGNNGADRDPGPDADVDALRAQLAEASESAHIGLFERDLVTDAGHWDATCFRLYGLDPARGTPGREAAEYMDPRDRERMYAVFDGLKQAPLGTAYRNHYRIRHPDGSLRHIETRGRVLPRRDGSGRRLVGVMIDVSDRTAAAGAQRELAEQLQQVAQAARVGLWRYHPGTGESEWNARMYELSGTDPAAGPLTVEAALALVHPADAADDDVARLIEHGTPMVRRLRIRQPDGSYRHVLVSASRLSHDEPHLAAAVVDLQDLVLAEERNRELADRLSLAVNSAGIGIWDIDVVAGSCQWNAQQYELHLMDPGEPPLPFDAWLTTVHPDDRERVSAQGSRFMANGGRYEDRFRIVRRDGSTIDVLAQAIAIKDAEGRVVRVVGTNRDVTVENQARADRDRVLRRLQLATSVANIGIWETLIDQRTEVLDDACCRMLGLGPGPQRRPSQDFLDIVHPDDLPQLMAEHGRAIDSGMPTFGPLAFRIRRDGEVRYLLSHYAVERDDGGRPLRILGTVLDVTDLRAAEAATRAAAERMAVATGLGGLGVFERDADDRFTYLDGMVAELYGMAPGQPMPRIEEGVERVLPEDRAAFVEARARMRATDEPVRCEYRARGNDGRLRDILSWRRRRLDADGRYAGEVGALMDITELRSAERRAREVARWLSIATTSAGMGVWEFDLRSNEFVADEQAHRLFDGQLAPSPIPLERYLGVVDPVDRPQLLATIDRARREGGAVDAEYRVLLPAGPRMLSARGEVHFDHHGHPIRLVGVVWDVTERRAAEAEARATSERLQLAAQGAGIGCWQWTVDPPCLIWDAQMYRLYGATPADGDPLHVQQLTMHADDVDSLEAARAAARAGGEFKLERRVRRLDGEVRWIASRGIRRGDGDDGNVFIGVSWDVTEARMAEAALRAKETAERASLAKSEFLSRMSHELRTPLNAIVGFTQLLELDRDDPLTATQRERVGLIRSSGWHLLNLINDVLDLARIESGRASVSMEVVAWRPVLEDAIAMVQPEATTRGIVLETRSSPEVPATVWGDPVRLRQVLLNLLSNAVKYNRDHGSVQVTVRSDGGHLVFAVRDSGRGMSPSQIERLFQPFNRLGIDSSAPAGTGIGLAISQRLMQQMEGAIEVDSALGVGSEFRIRVRSARVEAPRAAPPPGASSGTLSMREDVSGTLLYIEDNPANSALVEQFLHFRPRVKLYQAADGATGLVMAAVCQPDLVLIDIRLPDMMGDEVLRELHRQPETQQIPCVAVSANAMPHDIESALQAGFVDYWTKPLEVTRFLRGIDERLQALEAARVARSGDAA